MEIFILYLILQLDTIGSFFGLTATFLAIPTFLMAVFGCILRDEPSPGDQELGRKMTSYLPKLVTGIVVCAALSAFIPSKSDALILLGAWVGLEAVQSEEVKEFSGKLYTYIDEELDQLIEEQGD